MSLYCDNCRTADWCSGKAATNKVCTCEVTSTVSESYCSF